MLGDGLKLTNQSNFSTLDEPGTGNRACRKKKTNIINLIHRASGSTWGHNFYMGTQNGSKLGI